jgi:glycosyltransferase involved in cell wall biosynthesis
MSHVADNDHILVSTVIAVRNDAEGLAHTLAALSAQTLAAERFEVIVVDDASTDATAAVARAHAGVRLISLPDAQGSYVARNRGLRAARGAVIAITDADCRPEPSWLERGAARIGADPAAVVGGHISMPLNGNRTLAAMVDVVNHLDQERYVGEGCAVTANLFAAADTFLAVGGFNERLQSSGDVEWTRRAVSAGHPLVYAPDTVVMHPPRTSARALLRKAKRTAEGMRVANRRRLLDTRRPYFDYRVLIPSHRDRWAVRLRENGVRPGRLGLLALGAGQVALVQLPHVLYALAADVRVWASGPRETMNASCDAS